MSTTPIRTAIIGASGYTGAELVRLLYHHPHVTLVALAAESNADQPIEALYPHFQGYNLPRMVKHTAIDYSAVDVVFCCLPHATSQEVINALPKHLVVIDLSADFRLRDPASYETWYGHAHQALELQQEAVYGLTEIYRENIKTARLIACPGCYPTSVALPLSPLLREKIIRPEGIIIDSKSGISGAGRSLKAANLFCEMNEGVKAYSVCNHRHMPEIEQTLTEMAKEPVAVHFTPQVVPMSRGMLSSIYVTLQNNKTVDDIRATLTRAYADEAFVQIAPNGHAPGTREVAGTNQCRIGIFPGRTAQQAVLVSVIDNLVKGASGQAVQNMNLRFGLPETAGLLATAVFP